MREDQFFHGDTNSPQDSLPVDAVWVDAEYENSPGSDLLGAPINDFAHAEMFAARYGREFAYIPDLGWRYYNGVFWEAKGDYEARLCVGKIIKSRLNAFARMAAFITDPGVLASYKRKRRRLESCGNHGAITRTVKLAADHLSVDVDKFDRYPDLLNVANGIVDLKTGVLHPHDPDRYLTRATGVAYDPDAKSDLWERAILEIADGDEALVSFLQEIAGIAATGDTSIQRFLYFFGQGANGKSLITALWAEALGGYGKNGYAAKLPSAMISGGHESVAEAPSPNLLSLRGRRFAVFDEQPGDEPFNDQRIKSFTGEDSVTARAPRGMPITFNPEFTMVGVGNHKPQVNESDYGIWRRILLVPFRRTFEPSRLGETLRGELIPILAWMVKGAVRFYKDGLSIPDIVIRETEAYREEADSVRQWLREKADTSDPNAKTDGKALFQSYCAHCIERRESPDTHNKFSRRLLDLKEFNFSKRDSNGKVLWKGIALRVPEPASE